MRIIFCGLFSVCRSLLRLRPDCTTAKRISRSLYISCASPTPCCAPGDSLHAESSLRAPLFYLYACCHFLCPEGANHPWPEPPSPTTGACVPQRQLATPTPCPDAAGSVVSGQSRLGHFTARPPDTLVCDAPRGSSQARGAEQGRHCRKRRSSRRLVRRRRLGPLSRSCSICRHRWQLGSRRR